MNTENNLDSGGFDFQQDSLEAAPPPFITSTLQQDAASKLGFSPSQTMSLAQQLYEGTDNPDGKRLSQSQMIRFLSFASHRIKLEEK